eukprot:scaffold4049_cov204-Alexandrium_tamarense.AAC.8
MESAHESKSQDGLEGTELPRPLFSVDDNLRLVTTSIRCSSHNLTLKVCIEGVEGRIAVYLKDDKDPVKFSWLTKASQRTYSNHLQNVSRIQCEKDKCRVFNKGRSTMECNAR